jgi:hypothetical protein
MTNFYNKTSIDGFLNNKVNKNGHPINAIFVSDNSGNFTTTSVCTPTELGGLSGIQSNIQSQLNGKLNKVTYSSNWTLTTDASGNITSNSLISKTELEYLNNVTSNIQAQLNDRYIKSLVYQKTETYAKTEVYSKAECAFYFHPKKYVYSGYINNTPALEIDTSDPGTATFTLLATGDYQINFSMSYPNTNYFACATLQAVSAFQTVSITSPNVNSVRFIIRDQNAIQTNQRLRFFITN